MPATEGGGAAGVLVLAVALALSPASVPAPPGRDEGRRRAGAVGRGGTCSLPEGGIPVLAYWNSCRHWSGAGNGHTLLKLTNAICRRVNTGATRRY